MGANITSEGAITGSLSNSEGTLNGSMKQNEEILVGSMTLPDSILVNNHTELINRDAPEQHPITAITNLQEELDRKIEEVQAMSNNDIENILGGFV